MYLWILTGLLIVITCAVFCVLKWRVSKDLRHLPTYPYLPIVGNMHFLLGGAKNAFRRLVEISDVMENVTLPFIFWAGIHPVIVVSELDDLKMVSNAYVEKPYFYDFARLWLGNGLVTAPGCIWRKNVKLLAGTFTREVIHAYQDIFNTQAKKLVKKLKLQIDSPPFNFMQLLTYTTLESICQRGLNILLHPECIYKHTRAYREFREHVAVLHNVSETVLKKRKRERTLEDNKNVTIYNNENSRPGFKTFLDILLDLSNSDACLSEEQIESEVHTIILAGQETVATTLFFILLVIGSKKDVQEKLYNEMKEIFGDSKRDVLKEDLDRMVYCEAVIHETLRLYPPAPMILREADRDLKLKSCIIPKGATCALNAWGAGRSRRVWGEDVLEFRPERWSSPGPSIMAFSIGKRSCMGKRYAMSILKTILAHCVHELVFISDIEKMKLKLDITLAAYKGNLMEVKLRDG